MLLVVCVFAVARYFWESGVNTVPHAADGSSLSGRIVPGRFEVVRVERADLIIARQRVAALGTDTLREFELPVQLLGVKSAPASDDGVEFTREFLASGTPSLDLDRRRVDSAGHFLAYVYVDSALLNQEVIRAGLGQADLYPGDNQTMHKNLVLAEKEARKTGRGIWASKGKQ
jgi:endonuclease YncB( thermonuclease family)